LPTRTKSPDRTDHKTRQRIRDENRGKKSNNASHRQTEKAKQLILDHITQRQSDDHRNKSESRHAEQYDRTTKIRLHPNLASACLKKATSNHHDSESGKQRDREKAALNSRLFELY